MIENKIITKFGIGPGTNYVTEYLPQLKTGLMFKLTDGLRKKGFTLQNSNSYIEINKIILTPLFKWERPDDWFKILINEGLYFTIKGYTSKGGTFTDTYSLSSYVSPMHYEPIFNFSKAINIPFDVTTKPLKINEYPLRVEVELMGSVEKFNFDVMFVYNHTS